MFNVPPSAASAALPACWQRFLCQIRVMSFVVMLLPFVLDHQTVL
jgi:hypothetical protein